MAAAAALYERLPTEEELQGSGFVPQDYALEPVEVWPENWPAFRLLTDMRTQWRIGMCGPTGLDYPALFVLMDFRGVATEDRQQLFDDLRVMEDAALTQIAVKYT